TAVEYGYNISPHVYRLDTSRTSTGAGAGDGADAQAKPTVVHVSPGFYYKTKDDAKETDNAISNYNYVAWTQLPQADFLRERDYELLAGEWPDAANEVVLVVNKHNEVSDALLYSMGLMDLDHLDKVMEAANRGEKLDDPAQHFKYEDAIGLQYTVFAKSQLYKQETESKSEAWVDMSDDNEFMRGMLAGDEGYTVTVVGVLRLTEDSNGNTGIGYTLDLTYHLMEVSEQTPVVKAQLGNENTNVLTGKEFDKELNHSGKIATGRDEVKKAVDKPSTSRARPGFWAAGESGGLSEEGSPLEDHSAETLPPAPDEPGSDPEPGNGTDPQPGNGTDPQPGNGTDPEPGNGTDPEPGNGTDPEPGNGTDPQPGNGTDPEPGNGTDPTPGGDDPQPEPIYTVRFLNYDGTLLCDAVNYADGERISTLPGSDPSRPADALQSYIFIGWISSTNQTYYPTANLPRVTESVDYRALYYGAPVNSGDDPDVPEFDVEELLQFLSERTPQEVFDELGIGPDNPIYQAYSTIYAMAYAQAYQDIMGGMMGELGDLSALQDLLAGNMDFDIDALYEEFYSQMDISDFMSGDLTSDLSASQINLLLAQMGGAPNTYQGVLDSLEYCTPVEPDRISIYPVDFDGKDAVGRFIKAYNRQAGEGEKVTYTDLIALMISSVTKIIDTISAVLIAFVAISLLVSSIMIAIITYISVLERIKEIGILRAIGASRRDISRIFNAETLIEGLLSGLLGVANCVLTCIPINWIIANVFEANAVAALPPSAGVVLVGISVLLNLIAGFIPATIAAGKDPVVALRTE
ncbi:MAG: FtsX-like permease family protein, partial [Coriobacteriales bacterium]|nr:FtsX-like permease family protein [Coriobacteriales bacterium]